MIEIDILKCPDKEVIGKHRYYLPEFSLGYHGASDLTIEDASLKGYEIALKNTPKGILVHEKKGFSYLSNGKKISGEKNHAKGDRVTVGNTTFVISEHSENPSESRPPPLSAEGQKKVLKAVKEEITRLKKSLL